MEVIQMGHIKTLDGEEVTGMIVEASIDELHAAGNILYRKVKVVPDRMDLANQAKQSAFVANFEEREKVEQRKEMRSILEELIIRSKDGLKADLLELKEKYSNFDAEEKK